MTTDIDQLVTIFRHHPFTVKIEGSVCDVGVVVISVEFYQMTAAPILGFDPGDKDVFTMTFYVDVFGFLQKDEQPYRTLDGRWLDGVLPPMMRSLLCHSLSHGEFIDSGHYAYAEYVFEYYFNYVTLYPRAETVEIDGVEYENYKGLDISDETRKDKLSFFHMQKTRELHRLFGISAVHWMNFIKDELNMPRKVENEEELEVNYQKVLAVKAQAKLLKESIPKFNANNVMTGELRKLLSKNKK